MPRRSGTDVLFRNGRVRRFFLPGAFCFSDAVLSVPPCAALSSSACIGRRPRLCRVSVCVVSPLVSCLRLCRVSVCAVSPLLPCAAPLFRFVLRCHPRSASVAVPVCAVSPLLPCAAPLSRPVPRCHPRPASVAVPVCAVSPLRFASHCHPLSASCRRSGLRMAAAGEFCGRFGGESVRTAGLLRPFPALRRFRSGRPPAFL